MYTSARCLFSFSLLLPVLLCTCSPVKHEDEGHHRERRAAPTLSDRAACQPGSEWPSTRVNTTQRLKDMRDAMVNLSIDAFIVLSDDAHGSEYPADSDLRRGFISGFMGSAGSAVVTLTKAALWTDGRYFLEAEDALDCNWLFMRSGETDVPSKSEWLTSELNAGDVVGADPFLVSNSLWMSFKSALEKANITMKLVYNNPVDYAWKDQPSPPETTINALEMKYAGRSWQDKVSDIYKEMEKKDIHGAYIVTSLDELAWLFNLRASDIAYNPFFISYAILEYYGANNESNRVRLYIYDKDSRLTKDPTDSETENKLYIHLNTGQDGSCAAQTGMCVEVHEYIPTDVVQDIEDLAAASAQNKFWVTYICNYAIFSAIPEAQRVQARSYIALAKAQKNPVERRGMETCYNRDSAVLVEFLAMIEKEVKEGRHWTEVSAAKELKTRRQAAEKNRGLSFASISGSGPNGAVIHYRPAPETDRNLTTSEMYLLDSGGQYLDCTTDVTRTMHYGTPTNYMIECYTRVLMGSIDLADVIWPEGLYGREIDALARAPLWAVGLEYRHGTGHGIGAYLSVHEGPGRISLTHARNPSEETLHPYMFFSDEPGFYEDGQFGIRLETIVMVDPTNTTYKFGNKQFLKFKPITLVPFEPNLIDYSLLSSRQIKWMNNYNKLTLDTIEPLLTSDLAKDWLRERTRPYVATPTSNAARPQSGFTAIAMSTAAAALTLLFLCVDDALG